LVLKIGGDIFMKSKWFLGTLSIILGIGLTASLTFPKGAGMPSQITAYNGKSFKGSQDPEYISYDQALREYLVKRIQQDFGIALDPKKYSGFDLLEIEALFKSKKSTESYESFLKMFPKRW
jgi:hypothetical protein